MSDSTYEARIQLGILDLLKQDRPNYSEVARKWEVDRTTLCRRFNGTQGTVEDANSECRQRLTNPQEEVLIDRINYLSNRGIEPTTQMVKNLAEEIIHGPVGKNWASQFVHRHNDKIKSLYLRNIDNARLKSEYAPLYKKFYDLVSLYLLFYSNSYTNLI